MPGPLLLLHGVTMSGAVWEPVVPLLADRFDLIVPTAAGHRGGPPFSGRATISALVDGTERLLDERGLDTVHVAGNSMGGWFAIELARRGRARSVCALAPAGFWTVGAPDERRATGKVRTVRQRAIMGRRVVPPLFRFGLVRRAVLRDAAEHADRLTHEQAVEGMQDIIGCTVAEDLLAIQEQIAPLEPLPCPVTIAIAEKDRIFPPAVHEAIARERLPGARFVTLPGVGHVPMIDAPELTAQVIAQSVDLA
jgi:pimeloyl-ACP methyl ester carboxylesterase